MAESASRRRRRRRARPRKGNQQNQQQYSVSLPDPPEEAWDKKSVKSFATKLKKAELHLADLLPLSLPDLQEVADKEKVEEAFGMSRGAALRALITSRMEKAGVFFVTGTLDISPQGHGFLRQGVNDYTPNLDTDVLLHKELIEKHNLQQGQEVAGVLATPTGEDQLMVLHEVLTVFGEDPEKQYSIAPFKELVPLYAEERLGLETEQDLIETRIVDLISPIGKGQRGLIVAPPRTGKTVLLQMIANALVTNHPDCHLIILLVDERPEEVTDFERSVVGENREIVASTFDEPPARHIKVAEMVIERAKAKVEQGEDVIILLDSITRLARAYNNEAPSNSKIMTGGLVADALLKPKRFFGAARNIEEGGSLSIIATALIDTGSRMDEVIFEEFKGTGNSEIVLDRKVADKRIFPALDVGKSGTRKEELLVNKEQLSKMWVLRRILMQMGTIDSMEFLLDKMKDSKTNEDFFATMNQ